MVHVYVERTVKSVNLYLYIKPLYNSHYSNVAIAQQIVPIERILLVTREACMLG